MNTDKKAKLKEIANNYLNQGVLISDWVMEALAYDNLDYNMEKTKDEINKLTAKLKQMEQI